jgi:putative transposase
MSQFTTNACGVSVGWWLDSRRRLPSPEMARKARSDLADGTFHVTSRGNRRQLIFADDGDRRFFLALLDRVASQLPWHLHGYCLLETHYHLVVESSVAQLSAGMWRLNATYAQCFNSRHGLEGHLFQGRFYAGLVEGDGHLLELTRYLALNPVRAGLCSGPAAWRWSSYGAILGLRPPEAFLSVDRVLHMFSPDCSRAQEILRRFVAEGSKLP